MEIKYANAENLMKATEKAIPLKHNKILRLKEEFIKIARKKIYNPKIINIVTFMSFCSKFNCLNIGVEKITYITENHTAKGFMYPSFCGKNIKSKIL